MVVAENIRLPAVTELARRAAAFLAEGTATALIGPPCCGISSLRREVERLLVETGHPCCRLDCRLSSENPTPARSQLRALADEAAKLVAPVRPVLFVDQVPEVLEDEAFELARALGSEKATWRAILWLGVLDAREWKQNRAVCLFGKPQAHLAFPELSREELLAIYRAIVAGQGNQWGESLFYFALDWCGTDLALFNGLSEHFFGDWRTRLHDDQVAEKLRDWLTADQRVAAYSRRVVGLAKQTRRILELLFCGAKVPRHQAGIQHEGDSAVRAAWLSGLLASNLLPEHHSPRHLLARWLVAQQLAPGAIPDPFQLLRRAANERINALLQDVEICLRLLVSSVLLKRQPDEWQKFFAE